MAGTDPYAAVFSAPSAPPRPPLTQQPAQAPPRPAEATADPYAAAFAAPAKLYKAADEAQHKVTAPLDQGIRNAARQAVEWTGTHVAAPVDAVLGAPQRAVAGAITAFGEGKPQEALGNAYDAAFHPDRAEHYQEGERNAVHADALLDKNPTNFWGHARNAAVKFGTETALDPLTWTPLGWVKKGEEAVAAGIHALPGAKAVGEKLSAATAPLRSAVDPTRGVAAEIGSQKAGEFSALQGEAKSAAHDYFEAHPDKKAVTEKERLDQQEEFAKAYIQHHAPERLGFNAPHYEELAKKGPNAPPSAAAPPPKPPGYKPPYPTMKQTPLGGIERTQGRGIPQANVIDKRDIGAPPMEEQGLPHPLDAKAPSQAVTSDAAASAEGATPHADMMAKAQQQKELSDSFITPHGRASMADNVLTKPGSISSDMKELLRDDPENQHLLAQWEKVEMPKALAKQVYGSSPPVAKMLGGFPVKVADALKDVMFLNPFPHLKNIMSMAYQSPGGAQILAAGLKLYAKQNTPAFKALVAQMQRIGATSLWLKEREGIFQKAAAATGAKSGSALGQITSAPARGLDWWSHMSHDQLWNTDNALRGAMYLQQKRLGKSDGEIAQYINAHMFDYAQQSELAEKLHNAGAPFAHWRIGSPQRQARAVTENPAATERMVRGEDAVNNEIPDSAGYKINFATPIDEAQKMVNPATFFPYLASTMGEEYREPLRLATGKDTIQDVVSDPTHAAGMYALERLAPGGETITDALENPYHSKADFLTRQGMGIMGAYPQAPPSNYQEFYRYYMAQPNMTSFRAQQLARQEAGRLSKGLR